MSDVFNLPMTVEAGREIDSKELVDRNGSFYATFYNAQGCISAAKAINAYDGNQERIRQLESHAIDKSGSVGHKSKEATHRDIEIDMIGELINKYNSGEGSVEDLHEHFRVTKVEK